MDYTMIRRSRILKMLLICGAGLSVQMLASGLELTPIDNLLKVSVAEANELGDEDMGQVSVAFLGQGSQNCEAAKRRGIELAPELLALASWPLDNSELAECSGVQHGSIVFVDDVLPAVEIAETLAVVSVTASEYGDMTRNESAPLVPPSVNQPLHPPLGQQLAALDTASLDEIRGGFELDGTGLKFSFGIERAVFINGELIASTTLNLRDLQRTAGAGGAPVTVPPGSSGALGIVQNGTGNNISTTITPNMAGTIIQNTLNDQKIQNVTTINASVNSMQTMRAMSVNSAIQSGIVGSLRR